MSELAAIPTALTSLPQWVNWRLETREGKLTKVPVDPKTGRLASSTDPKTWASWITAVEQLRRIGGIGFVFAKDGGFVGIDLDHCRAAETGVIEPWAIEIIRKLNGYTELSPSCTGIHVIVRGKLPEGRRRKGPIEMYDSARFFTVTGKVISV